MRKILIIYLWFIVLLLMSPNLVILSYGKSDCEKSNWRSPLEHDLTNRDVNRPFSPSSHYGTDYKAADGDNVLVVTDGIILKKSYDFRNLDRPDSKTGLMTRGWGRYVVVKHKDGSTTLYAHLQKNSTSHLSEGMPVGKGDTIGKADSSGGVTGPHLHFEYTPNGKWWSDQSKKDPNPCLVQCPTGSATLTLSGPDAPSNGSQYSASGGTAPYTWSITKGSIDSNGVVTVSGQCGAATVTATDSCSNTGSKDVRMPNGRWVFTREVLAYSPYYLCISPAPEYGNDYSYKEWTIPHNSSCDIDYTAKANDSYQGYYYDTCWTKGVYICVATSGKDKKAEIGMHGKNLFRWSSLDPLSKSDLQQVPSCIPMQACSAPQNLGNTYLYEWRCQ